MKRAFSVLVCAAMIFSLTACGEASVSDEKDAAEGDAAASGHHRHRWPGRSKPE